ncbi:MAG: sigma-70 family RNA polymerase sigma factor [Acidobacteria bacterium]|nr:MAG: sigma-70 family RNA polymerase sigma factor [Acidobacteriota bacterium]
MATTDPDLVALALDGSEKASRELVRRYERPVYNLIARMVGNPALAEDLAQETFLRMFRGLKSYDPGQKFSNWLFRIAHNLTIDHLRLRRLDTVPLDEDPAGRSIEERVVAGPADDPVRALERADLAAAVERGLARLRPEYRQLVVLRYIEELSYEDIVEVTGLPLGTVKSFLHRARAAMVVILSAGGWGRGDVG